MAKKSNLLKAFDAASEHAHKRTFEVAGADLSCPRLSLQNQAIFEKEVRKTTDAKDFSLSLTRNRAVMEQSGCIEQVVKDLRAEGLPEKFASDADAQLWEAQLQAGIMRRWEPYARAIFAPFDTEVKVYAVMLSLQQEYGTELERTAVKGKDQETVEVNRAFVEQLFGDDQALLDTVFLWVIGLVNIPDEVAKDEAVKSAKDLVDKYGGGSGNEMEPSKTNSET